MNLSSVNSKPTLGVLMSCVVCVIVGVVGAECFVRLVVPYSIFYSTWYEPGIHQPDEELGFVFTPNYDGGMRQLDQTWRVPLRLDKNGFRVPVSTNNDNAPKKEVIVLGGYSMMFSYGLPTDETVAAQIAKNSKIPIKVHTLSQPGFNIPRDFYKFKRFLAEDVRPSVVVICLLIPDDYEALRAEYSPMPPKFEGNPFRNHDSLVLAQPGLPEQIGRPFYQSYVLAGTCRIINNVHPTLFQKKSQGIKQPRPKKSNPDDILDQHFKNDLITNMRNYFEQQGAKLIVVALHGNNPKAVKHLTTKLPKGIVTLDLHDSLKGIKSDWKADGHYGPQSAAIVGRHIADAIQPLLENP